VKAAAAGQDRIGDPSPIGVTGGAARSSMAKPQSRGVAVTAVRFDRYVDRSRMAAIA